MGEKRNADWTRCSDSKVTRPIRMLVHANYAGCEFAGGYVLTEHGVVGVYTQSDYTALNVIIDGRNHERSWGRQFSERGLVTQAARFARDLAEPES